MAIMSQQAAFPHFLITGPGGAGLSTALDIYADLGFLMLAGVNPANLREVILPLTQGTAPVAFTLRLDPAEDGVAAAEAVKALKESLPNLKVLALDAPEAVLVQRYQQSEKKHGHESPALSGLQAAISNDKKQRTALKELKDYSIDTSTTTALELRHKIVRVLGMPIENENITVYITSFGFKYGAPQDAELMFDMRFITNPFYDEALRPLTGLDAPVRDFIFGMREAQDFFAQWSSLVASMLPMYQAQGKTRLAIAIGCTGGKHRSVCMAHALANYLKAQVPGCQVVLTHRERQKWGTVSGEAVSSITLASPTSACAVGEQATSC